MWWVAVLLGLLQALTEFLPISSSGHLLLARAALDFDAVDGLTFDVAVHVGTLAAIVVYFRKELTQIARGFLRSILDRDPDDRMQRLSWYVVVACIPAILAGLLLEDAIETYVRHPSVVVVTLALGALLFFAVERFCRQQKTMEQMTLKSAIVIGVLQTLALIPGVSRSGITIAAGMIENFRRDEAARFSFVMSTPLLAGAGLKKSLDITGQAVTGDQIGIILIGVVTSAVAGWLVIRFLLRFLRTNGLGVFAWYRLVLAAVVAWYVFF